MKLGLVDADMIAKGGARFPNLALMKIAAKAKHDGREVVLVLNEQDARECDVLSVSKVFSATQEPEWVERFGGAIRRGGTGYYYDSAPPLDDATEHIKPLYEIYAPYVQSVERKGARPKWLDNFDRAAIGFTTRGCVRRCAFCVNRNKTRVERWSRVDEFDGAKARFIVLLDDNVFAYKDWENVFQELETTGKPFCFKQGLDLRLTTEEKARTLERVKYKDEIYFAFDDVKDAEVIESKLETFRRFCPKKNATAYILTGYRESGVDAIISALNRVEILARYGVKPYIMRYDATRDEETTTVLSGLSAWCNQPNVFKKLSYFEANERRSKKAVDVARRILPRDAVKRLEKTPWKNQEVWN